MINPRSSPASRSRSFHDPPHQRQDRFLLGRQDVPRSRVHRRHRQGRATRADVRDRDEDWFNVGDDILDPVQLQLPSFDQRQQHRGEDRQAGSLPALASRTSARHEVNIPYGMAEP